MSTKLDFYLGRGAGAQWLGSIAGSAHPDVLLTVPLGRRALTATSMDGYSRAVAEVIAYWASDGSGESYPSEGGWPWPWPTSHWTDWTVTFDPDPGSVFLTVSGGVRWHRIDPLLPQLPDDTDPLGPPDILHWLRNPMAAPSMPMPLMRALQDFRQQPNSEKADGR
jgi:hypothetical protein